MVDRKLLTVTASYGRKAAQVDPRQPHRALAQRLLQELVEEVRARKGSTI
jgi:hypothetical protein